MSKMWKLHQIVLDDDLVDLINKEGWKCHVKAVAHTEALMKGDPTIGLMHNCYDHVANIVADDLEHVYEAGNIGPEDRIERLNEMHSISVGDIVENDEGAKFVCAKIGWEKIDESEAA
tara:strand:+ start:359 stop:712 length:354 start_codon:yes stop_codon:yes gene_type:complete